MSIAGAIDEVNILKIRCGICNCFLSVKPILLDLQSGLNICGRCTIHSASAKRNHCYELLATQFTFPCRYVTEGCTVNQSLNTFDSHEKFCTYRICKCYCTWYGNVFSFIRHYENQHKDLVIKSGDIFNAEKKCGTFLFENHPFYFFVTCYYDDEMFRLQVIGITEVSQKADPLLKCKQIGSNVSAEFALDFVIKMQCYENLNRFSLSVEISDEYTSSVLEQIICPNCSVSMTPPILRCPEGHLTCLECTGAWFTNCKDCDFECQFTCDSELECITINAQFSCKWDCGKTFGCSEIREHELACEKRLFNCWHSIDCGWSGYLNELLVHDGGCSAFLNEMEESCLFGVNIQEVSFPGATNLRTIYHLIVYNCCFNIVLDRIVNVTTVYVNQYDLYGFGWFTFSCKLTHPEDVSYHLNKTYELQHTNGGIYKAEIPKRDIDKFGGPEFYKITIQVNLLTEEERKNATNEFLKRFKNSSPL